MGALPHELRDLSASCAGGTRGATDHKAGGRSGEWMGVFRH